MWLSPSRCVGSVRGAEAAAAAGSAFATADRVTGTTDAAAASGTIGATMVAGTIGATVVAGASKSNIWVVIGGHQRQAVD